VKDLEQHGKTDDRLCIALTILSRVGIEASHVLGTILVIAFLV